MLDKGMGFAWKVIGSLTTGMLLAFVTGDIFIIHEHVRGYPDSASEAWYYPLALVFFASTSYLLQSEPLRFQENKLIYAFVCVVAVCFFGFLLLHL